MILMNHNAAAIGSVLRIERASIHDGKGLRTVLFLRGAPLDADGVLLPNPKASDSKKAMPQTAA